jgi:hypothetical protein
VTPTATTTVVCVRCGHTEELESAAVLEAGELAAIAMVFVCSNACST